MCDDRLHTQIEERIFINHLSAESPTYRVRQGVRNRTHDRRMWPDFAVAGVLYRVSWFPKSWGTGSHEDRTGHSLSLLATGRNKQGKVLAEH